MILPYNRPWFLALSALAAFFPDYLLAAESHLLKSRHEPGEIVHVEQSLDVGGELKVADEGKIRALKMSVVGRLTYDEKQIEAKSTGQRPRSAVRHYQQADAVIKIEQHTQKPALRSEHRLLCVEQGKPRMLIYSPQGPLSRDELDLVDGPGNSMLVDDLLPKQAVSVGKSWPHADDLLAALLGLDAISQSNVSSVLKSIDRQEAKIELAGKVLGAVEGVATEIELKAKYTFDRAAGRVTRLGLLIKEKRSIGHVGPGLDVVARLQMTIAKTGENPELAESALIAVSLESKPASTLLEYASPGGGFVLLHGRRWHILSDKPDSMAMRFVDRGDLIAQCNVSRLVDLKPGSMTSLDEFQADIERSLGKSFGQFVHAAQAPTEKGPTDERPTDQRYVVQRVVATGVVAELPIQWIYYLVADAKGRRVVLAFTFEAELADRLGDEDTLIVDSVRPLANDAPAKTARK